MNGTDVDVMGVYGTLFHYSLVIAIVGSAFLIFMHLWRKGRLDMDEQPKFQMMEEEEMKEGESIHGSS
jgi:hypothetical protein